MPASYDDDWGSVLKDIYMKAKQKPKSPYEEDIEAESAAYRRRAIKMDRIARKVMDALNEDGRGDLLLIKDDEVREWWAKIMETERVAREAEERKRLAQEEKERIAKIKEDLLNRLTPDEKKALGIKGK